MLRAEVCLCTCQESKIMQEEILTLNVCIIFRCLTEMPLFSFHYVLNTPQPCEIWIIYNKGHKHFDNYRTCTYLTYQMSQSFLLF